MSDQVTELARAVEGDAVEARAYAEYKDAARCLAEATSKMKAAQGRFQNALANLTKIVAPLE